MKMKKILIYILIFLAILFGLGNFNKVLAVSCSEIAVDSYEGFTITLLNGGLDFSDAVGQVSADGSNFIDVYDFLVHGVDINKIKELDAKREEDDETPTLRETYINALMDIAKRMENTNSGNAMSSGATDIEGLLAGKYGNENNNYEEMLKNKDYEGIMNAEKAIVVSKLEEAGARQDQIAEVEESFDDVGKVSETEKTGDKGEIADAVAEGTENDQDKNDKIYKQPSIQTGTIKKDGTLQDMISDGDKFITAGNENTISAESLQNLSGRIYNILLEIGVGVSVIIGIILGIKFMLSGVEEKAEVKKMIWVYVVGCVVIFGSFGIWKIVVTILEQI